MKILQVIHDFLPHHQAGSELYCYHLSKALQAHGHDVRLFYSEIDPHRSEYSTRQGIFDGLPFWEIINNHRYSSFEETYGNPHIEQAFSDCLNDFQPDVVHFHHLLGLSYGCIPLCKKEHIPIVFTLHDYWLTCPRGGGQRFRGEGQICHAVDPSLCAECISRYSFGASRGVSFIKKIVSRFEPARPGDLLPRMRKGKIVTPNRSFVSPGQCNIEGDTREVLYAHPPSRISFRCDVPPESMLQFSIAMHPHVYDKTGNGVTFRIHCDRSILYERSLHPKVIESDRGWHTEQISLFHLAGTKREFTLETQSYPSTEIDFCTACWAEPKIVHRNHPTYIPPVSSRFQEATQRIVNRVFHQSLRKKITRRTEHTFHLMKQVDLFIAPSRFLQTKFLEYGLAPEKIVFSDYGIRQQGYVPSPRQPGWPIHFTFIGTLVSHKGLHILIDAFNRLDKDSALLHVYGNTQEFTDYVRRVKSMISHPGISFCGRAENNHIPQILSNTDVLIVPSIWFENSPITIHEAFLAKIPVITSRFGGMADLVREGENGLLFDVGDAESLFHCLQKFVANPSLIDTLRPCPEEVKTNEKDAEWMIETYGSLQSKEKRNGGFPHRGGEIESRSIAIEICPKPKETES